MTAEVHSKAPPSIPPWRDTRYIAVLLQILFVVAVVAAGWFLIRNMLVNLKVQGVPISFGFLDNPAGIAISESSLTYVPADTFLRAFVVGIANTLRVAITGIILATLLGLLVGISRLSTNWMLRNLAATYVEIIRNVPLLLQLVFWAAAARAFPNVRESLSIGSFAFLNSRSVVLAWPRATGTYGAWLPWVVGGLLAAVGVYLWRRWDLRRRDRPGAILPWALAALAALAAIGFLLTTLTGGAPLRLDVPVLERFNFQGGTELTTAFFALVVGLTLYTGAFIGEIVRAGILAVNKGQREASRALSLSEWQALRLIVLPQAMRVVIPPLTNQYLNLTKNSSLAIAIGYPDLFSIGFTMFNQTGQTIPIISMIMLTYLTLSLLTSLVMNFYNRRIQIVER